MAVFFSGAVETLLDFLFVKLLIARSEPIVSKEDYSGILIFVIFLGDKWNKAALLKQIKKTRFYAASIPI